MGKCSDDFPCLSNNDLKHILNRTAQRIGRIGRCSIKGLNEVLNKKNFPGILGLIMSKKGLKLY